jgi:hypothetical protein
MKSKEEILNGLAHCYGTQGYHYNAIFGKNFVYTDGIKYLIEAAGAAWLMQAIFSYKRTEEFQLWKLEVMSDKTAVLTMKEDTDCPNIVEQKIHYTDFPLEEIEFYAINDHCREDGTFGDRVVLMLKSEY